VGDKGYIAFNWGLGPLPGVENNNSGYSREEYGFPTTEFEKDKLAYEKLMRTLEGRKSVRIEQSKA
jgi:hypothetical protein